MTWLDSSRSWWNEQLFRLRSRAKFSRSGYREFSSASEFADWRSSLASDAARELNHVERLAAPLELWQNYLGLPRLQKNLATLWTLEKVFSEGAEVHRQSLASVRVAVDAGTQDFARLPALQFFLGLHSSEAKFLGVELDAFPPLRNGHSRADIARYLAQSVGNATFVAADFFSWQEPMDFVSAFFPFVSPHPALAWGLPARFGNARLWVAAISRNLKPGGLALVIHQGAWEEEEFDAALPYAEPKLRLLTRLELNCPFYPLPHPMRASLYASSFHPDPVS